MSDDDDDEGMQGLLERVCIADFTGHTIGAATTDQEVKTDDSEDDGDVVMDPDSWRSGPRKAFPSCSLSPSPLEYSLTHDATHKELIGMCLNASLDLGYGNPTPPVQRKLKSLPRNNPKLPPLHNSTTFSPNVSATVSALLLCICPTQSSCLEA